MNDIQVTVKFKPETNEIGVGSNLSNDPVGRLAMQQVLQKAITAIDMMGRQQQSSIVLPDPIIK